MRINDKEESKEVAKESVTTLSQILTAAGAAFVAGADPYVAGAGVFVSQIIDLRSKIKFNRVERFVIELGKYMESVDADFDSENIDSDSFGDFFEELLVKVGKTNSEKKLMRFRNLIFNQIIEPRELDITLKYLDLVDKLSDNQIILLSHWMTKEEERKAHLKEKGKLEKKLNEGNSGGSHLVIEAIETPAQRALKTKLKTKIEEFTQKVKVIETERKALVDSFPDGEFDFLVNEMRSLGLLHVQITTNKYLGERVFTQLVPSQTAKMLYSFIQDSKN